MNNQFPSSKNWHQFLCEIDCDRPYSAFQNAFDEYRKKGSTGALVLLCDAPEPQHHPAFIERCSIWADRELRKDDSGLAYLGSFPWSPSTRLGRIEPDDLHSFFGDERFDTLADGLEARSSGVSFHVSILSSDWRSDDRANLEELLNTIAEGAGSKRDPDRPCTVFINLQCKPGNEDCGKPVRETVKSCAGDHVVIDDFPLIAPSHVHTWYDRIMRRKAFAGRFKEAWRAELIDYLFEQDQDPRPVSTVLNAVQRFFSERMPMQDDQHSWTATP